MLDTRDRPRMRKVAVQFVGDFFSQEFAGVCRLAMGGRIGSAQVRAHIQEQEDIKSNTIEGELVKETEKWESKADARY